MLLVSYGKMLLLGGQTLTNIISNYSIIILVQTINGNNNEIRSKQLKNLPSFFQLLLLSLNVSLFPRLASIRLECSFQNLNNFHFKRAGPQSIETSLV